MLYREIRVGAHEVGGGTAGASCSASIALIAVRPSVPYAYGRSVAATKPAPPRARGGYEHMILIKCLLSH
jgi:hypothetical protein